MRKAEIMNLTWQEIILKTEFIVLGDQRTKNKKPEGRFRRILRLLTSWGAFLLLFIVAIFLDRAKCLTAIRTTKLLKLLELLTFTFRDLRHCAINNLRLAGNDHFVIKQASGAKTGGRNEVYEMAQPKSSIFRNERHLDGHRYKNKDCINHSKYLIFNGAPTVTRTRS